MAGFGEMLAKLMLDSSGFDKNIKKAKKEVDGFSKAGAAMGKELAGQFKKIAGAALAFKGAEDVFKAFINSSQTLSDAFAANMTAMRTAVDNFMYSLANADFTPFNQGLDGLIAKAKEAYAAMDQLGNTQMAVDFLMATSGSDYRTYMAKARNKDLSVEERQGWLAKAEEEMNKITEAQKTLERDAREAVKTQLATTAGIDAKYITEEAINKALLLDTRGSNIQERVALKAAFDDYKTQIAALNADAASSANEKEEYEWYTFLGPDSNFTKPNNATVKALRDIEGEKEQLTKANIDMLVAYAALFKEDKEDLRKLYATAQSYVSARNQVAEMTTSINELRSQINSAKVILPEETKTAIKNRSAITTITEEAPFESVVLPQTVQSQDAQAWVDNPFLEKSGEKIKALEEMNEVVGMLGSSFSQLGSAIGGSASEMLTFIGSVLNAVQAVIPFIGYLMAEQVAHQGVASAAASEAVAKSFSAHAGIPFAGIALGASAAAAIISTISAIPKFAEGGVVTSATLGVFGEAGPEAVMPLDRLEEFLSPRELRVTGQIKSSGKDLVVIIDNYNRTRNG